MNLFKAKLYSTAFYPRYNFYVKIDDVEQNSTGDCLYFHISWRENNGCGQRVHSVVREDELENFVL